MLNFSKSSLAPLSLMMLTLRSNTFRCSGFFSRADARCLHPSAPMQHCEILSPTQIASASSKTKRRQDRYWEPIIAISQYVGFILLSVKGRCHWVTKCIFFGPTCCNYSYNMSCTNLSSCYSHSFIQYLFPSSTLVPPAGTLETPSLWREAAVHHLQSCCCWGPSPSAFQTWAAQWRGRHRHERSVCSTAAWALSDCTLCHLFPPQGPWLLRWWCCCIPGPALAGVSVCKSWLPPRLDNTHLSIWKISACKRKNSAKQQSLLKWHCNVCNVKVKTNSYSD